jgi:hypothetical protein
MSYTIFYNKQFVRLSDGRYIVIIEQGDNNVWEYNNKRRARDWEVKRKDMSITDAWTKDEILAYVDKLDASAKATHEAYAKGRNEEPAPFDPRNFGDYVGLAMNGKRCGKTTLADFKNFFVSGMKKALTFDELSKFGFYISLHCPWYMKENLENIGIKDFKEQTIRTEEEFLQAVKTCENHNQLLTMRANVGKYMADRIKKEFHPRNTREKEPKHVEKYFVVEVYEKGSTYFIGNFLRASKSGFKYSYDYGGKRYLTEKEAAAAVKKQSLRFTQYDFKAKEVNQKVIVYV